MVASFYAFLQSGYARNLNNYLFLRRGLIYNFDYNIEPTTRVVDDLWYISGGQI